VDLVGFIIKKGITECYNTAYFGLFFTESHNRELEILQGNLVTYF